MDASPLFANVYALIAFAGGGGSSSSGGGGSSGGGSSFGGASDSSGGGSWTGLVLVFALVGAALVSGKYEARRRQRREAAGRDALSAQLPTLLTGWSEEQLLQVVRPMVIAIQRAWSRSDIEAVSALLTPRLLERMGIQLDVIDAMGRRNGVEDLEILGLDVVDASPLSDSSSAKFVVEVRMRAFDTLVDVATGAHLVPRTQVTAVEYWTLVPFEGAWRLDSIGQSTHDSRQDDSRLVRFAQQHDLVYDADFGRMMLPDRGVLFDDASLTSSDVNNHVAGYLRGRLVQLYSYVRDPESSRRRQVVVQASLPRSFHDILVRRRSALERAPRGLERFEFESAAFNEAWAVFAHPDDDVAAFELLHPAFLERLTELSFDVGIEVVDSDLYLFSDSNAAQYETMFELLDEAFDELRL